MSLDLAVIVLYLAASILIGKWLGGSSGSSSDYFTSKGEIPWWASSLSIVATETSLLTVISTPALAYNGNLTFLQLPLGYIAGRIIVAYWLLPLYFQHSPESTYVFLGKRFGTGFRKLVSTTFIFTRVLADGVRLFAAAIPIFFFTGWDFKLSILILSLATLIYTYSGGLKAVIWVDVLQWATFLISGLLMLYFLWPDQGLNAIPAQKWTFAAWPDSWSSFLTGTYTFPAAFIGGAFLSMASHGTDHIIVQRVLACATVKDGQRALIVSGLVVFIQFAIFLAAGLFMFAHFEGKSPAELGLNRADELSMHAVNSLFPAGLRGFFVAGLLAAAMSTLSSSLSALSASTFYDLFPRLAAHPKALTYSRWLMVFWCLVFAGFASSFTSTSNPVIEIGLSIAGFTYGALLGASMCGHFLNIGKVAAGVGFMITIIAMIVLVTKTTLAWPWYTLTGVLVYLSVGYIAVLTRVFFNREA